MTANYGLLALEVAHKALHLTSVIHLRLQLARMCFSSLKLNEKMSILQRKALLPEATRSRARSSGQFLASSVLRTCTNCNFFASGQNYDIAVRFSDPDFLKRSNNFFTLCPWPLTFWPLTLNVWPKSNNLRRIYRRFSTFSSASRHAVNLTFWLFSKFSRGGLPNSIPQRGEEPNFTEFGENRAPSSLH